MSYNGFIKLIIIILLLPTNYLFTQNNNSGYEINELLIKEDYFKVIPLLETILSKDSSNTILLQKLGIAYQKTFRFDKAIKVFSLCSKLDKNNKDYLLSLGTCYAEFGNLNKAEEIFSLVFSADTSNLRAGINLAELLFRRQNYRKAVQIYQGLLLFDSTNTHLLRRLGNCFMQLDSLELSNNYFSTALTLNRNDHISLQMAAGNYLKMQQTAKALKLIESYKADMANNPVIKRLYGDVYFGMKNYTEALRGYYIARDLGDTTAYIFQKIGISNYLYGNSIGSNETQRKELCFKIAKKALEKSFTLDSNPITAYFLALSEQKLGNFKAAVDLLETSINIIQPDILHDIYLKLGENLLALNNHEQVANTYELALLLKPGNTDLILKTASLYDEFLHDYLNALRFYREYIKQPDAEKAKCVEVNKRIAEISNSAK